MEMFCIFIEKFVHRNFVVDGLTRFSNGVESKDIGLCTIIIGERLKMRGGKRTRPFAPSHLETLSDDDRAKANVLRLNAIRKARKTVNNKVAMNKLFNEYAEHFHSRPGGYTRVVKAGYRDGDNAAMAVIAQLQP